MSSSSSSTNESGQDESKTTTTPKKMESVSEVAAALMIQKHLRGTEARVKCRRLHLWNAWNTLDNKEESELVHTHDHYELLKTTYQEKKPPGSRQRSASVPSISAAKLRSIQHLPLVQDEKKPTVMEDGVPRLPDVMTLDFVSAVMDFFKHDNNRLVVDDVMSIINQAHQVLRAEPNVVCTPVHTRITVVGDLHGQLDDLLTIFKLNGLPSLRNVYLFNGDFVDRGQFSLECIVVLFCFKLLLPNSFFLNRGNHEAEDINSRDGFERECLLKYNGVVFDAFSEAFAALPLATCINNAIFVVHGGLTWKDNMTLAQINELDRFVRIPPVDGLVEQMLWSDPRDIKGREFNPRGASLIFGEDVVDNFLQTNHLQRIIRSHECVPEGFKYHFSEKCITVFSASNYCGVVGNDGAFVCIDKHNVLKVIQYSAQPKGKLSRYRMRHTGLENDVISRLLRRIAENRLALLDNYAKLDAENTGTITRVQWAQGLSEVLGIQIPFLEFQSYLGLAKLGVDGVKNGVIDYADWVSRFRIKLGGQPVQEVAEATATDTTAMRMIERLAELLMKNRFELESLFRYFDADGDGVISVGEMYDGIMSLTTALDMEASEQVVRALVALMDTNNNGTIEVNEFYQSFELVDAELSAAMRRGREYQRGGSGDGGADKARRGSF